MAKRNLIIHQLSTYLDKSPICYTTQYWASMTLSERSVLKHCGNVANGENALTRIFSFSHNGSYPIKDKFHYLSQISFVICKCFEFGQIYILVVVQRVTAFMLKDWLNVKARSDRQTDLLLRETDKTCRLWLSDDKIHLL